MKRYVFLILLTAFTYLNASMENDYLIWDSRKKDGYIQQKKASVVFSAKILKVDLIKDSENHPPLVHVFIKIKPVDIYRKPKRLKMPRILRFSYVKIDYSTGWVGPASSSKNTPTIPKEGRFYTFYLNDDLKFSAAAYSIEFNKNVDKANKR